MNVCADVCVYVSYSPSLVCSTARRKIVSNVLVVGLNCAEEECMLLIVVGKLRVLGTWQ